MVIHFETKTAKHLIRSYWNLKQKYSYVKCVKQYANGWYSGYFTTQTSFS